MKKTKPESKQHRKLDRTEPRFPYTTKPASLRRLMKDIPSKPKPPKFDKQLLQSWGFRDANDYSMIRVLKELGLLNATNEPTELYSQFMHISMGPAALSEPIRRVYQPLFAASHEPYRENPESLRNMFNIHSGGSERSIEQQIQTFKALCENADFKAQTLGQTPTGPTTGSQISAQPIQKQGSTVLPIQINLHIHLPENKTRRDYECIIEDIARYIFQKGNSSGGSHDQ